MQRLSILIAEHQELMLGAISDCLDKRYEIAGVVKDGASLVSEALRLSPDVAIVDIYLPKLNGLDATAELIKRHCASKVVVLTSNTEPIILRAAFASGAVGYVLHNRMAVELNFAIDAAIQGRSFISEPVAHRHTELLL
jgi:DNA-binding NarL/FixJ family response regulator